MMRRKALYYSIFFVVLFVIFYFGLTKIIPGFGEVELPVLSYVQPFSFINQEGKTVTRKDIEGKVCVVDYFFTTCKGICPKLNTNMKQVYLAYKQVPDFMMLSHTVDPETDTVARMKQYADSLGADVGHWMFLTGRKDSLYHAARASYLLDDPKNNNNDIGQQFIHTQFLALVDKEGRVRKIVDGLKADEIADLKKSIDKLLNEKSSGPRFANSLFGNNPN